MINMEGDLLHQVINHSKDAKTMPNYPYPLGNSITNPKKSWKIIKTNHWKANPARNMCTMELLHQFNYETPFLKIF